MSKVDEARKILAALEMPAEQQNERSAYCLLALLNVKPNTAWKDAHSPLVGITPMMDQQYGGLIMWIPGGIFFYGVMSVVFFKWSGRGEDDQASAQVGWVAPT